MSTLKTDNISPNGSTVNVTSGLNVQGGATLAAVKITGNLDVDGNVFGVKMVEPPTRLGSCWLGLRDIA